MRQFIRRRTDELLLASIVVLSAAATLTIVIDQRSSSARAAIDEQFQSLVGGLGLGCHSDLARCAWQFDPRLMGDGDTPLDVVLGSSSMNPWHAMKLFPILSDQHDLAIIDDDASSPSPQPPITNP